MNHKNQSSRPSVCMVAYSDYVFDARIRREAETVAAGGFDVLVLKTQNGDVPERYVLNGVNVRELPLAKYQGKNPVAYVWSYVRFLVMCTAICLRRLVRGELDVVHVHNLPDFLVFAGLIPRLAGKKVVLDVHDTVPETFATKFSSASMVWKALCLEEKISTLVAHKVICVNDLQRDAIVGRGLPKGKTFVSMNVPDPAIFQRSPACRRSARSGGDLFNVVYHGTMAERLGVDLIIRAIAQLRERIPGVRLHLWGHGDDMPKFYELAKELGIQDRVDFMHPGYRVEELPRRLCPMHLGLVGNRRSVASHLMLPVKLVEYVSLGIPVVAPRLPTIEHYFTDDMVTFYEPEDIESFSESIYRMYANPQLRESQASEAEKFLDHYGWERQGAELVDFYRHLVESRA